MVENGVVSLELPPKLIPVFDGEADIRGAHGGRGSAKTRTFAKMTAVRAYMWDMAGREGIILCGRQFMNSLDDSSLSEIKAAIKSEPWLEAHFEIGEKYVKTRSGRIHYKFSGLDRNVAQIKSKAKILLCWVDEAEPVTEEAWRVLIPTLREEDSELWVTWNPESKRSPAHERFRLSKDPRVKVVEMNWRDNPWFPSILDRLRKKDLDERPDSYGHIWEGEFITAQDGAYFVKQLIQVRAEKRIGHVARDPYMSVRVFVDIGGTGAKADNFVMIPAQFVGASVRVLDHYEAQGQEIGAHLAWLKAKSYTPDKAEIWLPHDGRKHDAVYRVTYESAFREAGYRVNVVPNQGAGAAMMRVEALRRLFPAMLFNEKTTEGLVTALGWYHEKLDPDRGIGLGPEHDWASHSCDSMAMMAIVWEQPIADNDDDGYDDGQRTRSAITGY